jgi:hypothetical protein
VIILRDLKSRKRGWDGLLLHTGLCVRTKPVPAMATPGGVDLFDASELYDAGCDALAMRCLARIMHASCPRETDRLNAKPRSTLSPPVARGRDSHIPVQHLTCRFEPMHLHAAARRSYCTCGGWKVGRERQGSWFTL